jgi:hypothetical protein
MVAPPRSGLGEWLSDRRASGSRGRVPPLGEEARVAPPPRA